MSKPYDRRDIRPLPGADTSIPLVYEKPAENVIFQYDRAFRKRPGTVPFYTGPANTLAPHSRLPLNIIPLNQTVLIDQASQNALLLLHDIWAPVKLTESQQTTCTGYWYSITPGIGSDTHYYLTLYTHNTSVSVLTVDLGDPSNSATWVTFANLAATYPAYFGASSSTLALMQVGPTNGVVTKQNISAYSAVQLPTYSNAVGSLIGLWVQQPGNTQWDWNAQDDRRACATAVYTNEGVYRLHPRGALFFCNGYREVRPGPWVWSTTFLNGLPSPTPSGTGLTGTYSWVAGSKTTLQSGEVVYGDVSGTFQASGIVLANQGAQFTNSSRFRIEDVNFLFPVEYATNTTGTLSNGGTVVTTTAHDFQVGEQVAFFSGGSPNGRQLAIVASVPTSTSFTLSLPTSYGVTSITLNGTSYITNGLGIIVYRTKANGSVYYEGLDLSPTQFVGTFTDAIADSSLGPQLTQVSYTRYPAPYMCYGLAKHQGRICVLTNWQVNNATTQTKPVKTLSLAFSIAASSQIYPLENSVNIPNSRTAKGTGLMSVNDTLYIFLDNGIFYIQGQLNDTALNNPTYALYQLSGDSIGCVAPNSLAKVGDIVYFMTASGPARLEGTRVDLEFGKPINKDLLATCNDFSQVVSYYWAAKRLLLFMAPTTIDTGDLGTVNSTKPRPVTNATAVFVYDLKANRWARWNGVNMYGGMCEFNGDLYYVSIPPDADTNATSSYQVYRMTSAAGPDDSGTPITMRYYTMWEDDGAPGVDKSYNRLQIFSAEGTDGQNFGLTIKTEKNWVEGVYDDNFTVSDFLQNSGYGQVSYGNQPYGSPELPDKVYPLSNQKAKSKRVTLENANREQVSVTAVMLEESSKYVTMKDD